jgi:Uma2 family endonuclease
MVMAVNIAQPQSSVADCARRRFSVADYVRMCKAGIFTEDDRVELIDGEICRMAPFGPLHAGTVKKLIALITSQLRPPGD